MEPGGRGAKSVGTGEPGSQKVNWPAESLGAKNRISVVVRDKTDYYVSAKNENFAENEF